MNSVVNSRSTGINADFSLHDRFKKLFLASKRVMKM